MLKRFVKRLLSCLLLAALFVLVVIGGTLGVQGWRLYRATAAQKPIASLYDEISSRPGFCLLYTSPSPRDRQKSRMPSSA